MSGTYSGPDPISCRNPESAKLVLPSHSSTAGQRTSGGRSRCDAKYSKSVFGETKQFVSWWKPPTAMRGMSHLCQVQTASASGFFRRSAPRNDGKGKEVSEGNHGFPSEA